MKKLIIFVCNGNIERSVIAATSLEKTLNEQNLDKRYFVDSYGLQGTNGTQLPKHSNLSGYQDEWEAAKYILNDLKLDIISHTAQTITPEVATTASVIIAMDKLTYQKADNSLLNLFPEERDKIHNFSELTSQQDDIVDLAGNSEREQHESMIVNINKTVCVNFGQILTWADKN